MTKKKQRKASGRNRLRQPAPGRHIALKFALHKMQRIALESDATEILYGGAAGGGKSHLMRVAAITWCLEIPGLQCSLYRRSYEEIASNHMQGPTGFPALLEGLVNEGYARITQKRITFYNGAAIGLKHLQYTKSLQKYQGPDIHALLIDELTHHTEQEYTYLRGRVRMPTKDKMLPPHLRNQFPRILTSSNPGSIGHHWVKKYFIQRPGKEPFKPLTKYNYRGKKGGGGKLRQFIPARLEDNPSLDPEEYGEGLEGMGDPMLIRALRMGDWNVVPGAMFGESWRDTINGRPWHVHPGFAIPMGWPLWRGADDGYEKEAAQYWFTQDPDKETIYVIDEIYRTHMEAPELAALTLQKDKAIVMQDGTHDQNGNPNTCFNEETLRGNLDTSAFTDTGQSDKQGQKTITRGEQMNRLGCKWTPVQKWNGSRVAGIQNFHRLLKPNKKAPPAKGEDGKVILNSKGLPLMPHDRSGIVFFARCVNAIRTIPLLPRSKVPGDEEDIADNAEDHAFDGVRYGVQFRIGKTQLVRVGGL